ncbi:hypothetical protein J132_10547 [Termitomyces sp. J132]|nr:hypothetical protein J132_10547 [Termitomyces sp. J132]
MVYFLSRVGVLVDVLMNVIFQTAALPNCQVIGKTVRIIYHIAFSSTAFLFFLRVRAVLVAFFAILWLGVLGGFLTVALVGNAVHLGPTRCCSATRLEPYASAAPITFAVNDTSVFLAISWRLLSTEIFDRGRGNFSIKSILLGKYLPTFSRALLQDGQVYYLVSVTSNIVVAVITWVGDGLIIMMFAVFNVVLTNMMACRVFRHTKISNFREETISTRCLASQLGHLASKLEKSLGIGSYHFTLCLSEQQRARTRPMIRTRIGVSENLIWR